MPAMRKVRAALRTQDANHKTLWLWVPAFAGTTAERSFMLQRVVLILVAALAAALATSADARQRRHPVDATPFAHAPCSVLANEPCAPYTCSVFNHGPCIPEIDYPIGQNLQLTIQSVPPRGEASKYQKPCSWPTPWLKNFCPSGTFTETGSRTSPVPPIR